MISALGRSKVNDQATATIKDDTAHTTHEAQKSFSDKGQAMAKTKGERKSDTPKKQLSNYPTKTTGRALYNADFAHKHTQEYRQIWP